MDKKFLFNNLKWNFIFFTFCNLISYSEAQYFFDNLLNFVKIELYFEQIVNLLQVFEVIMCVVVDHFL